MLAWQDVWGFRRLKRTHTWGAFTMVRMGSLFALVLTLASSLTYGQSMLGELHGITRDESGLPVPGVQVIVHRVDEKIGHSVISNEHGAFRIENLIPGRYQLTASKEGFGIPRVSTIELAAQQ